MIALAENTEIGYGHRLTQEEVLRKVASLPADEILARRLFDVWVEARLGVDAPIKLRTRLFKEMAESLPWRKQPWKHFLSPDADRPDFETHGDVLHNVLSPGTDSLEGIALLVAAWTGHLTPYELQAMLGLDEWKYKAALKYNADRRQLWWARLASVTVSYTFVILLVLVLPELSWVGELTILGGGAVLTALPWLRFPDPR